MKFLVNPYSHFPRKPPSRNGKSGFAAAVQSCSVIIIIIGVISFLSAYKAIKDKQQVIDYHRIELLNEATRIVAEGMPDNIVEYQYFRNIDMRLLYSIMFYEKQCVIPPKHDLCSKFSAYFPTSLDFIIPRAHVVSPLVTQTSFSLLCDVFFIQGSQGSRAELHVPDFSHPISVDASQLTLVIFGNDCPDVFGDRSTFTFNFDDLHTPISTPMTFIVANLRKSTYPWYFSVTPHIMNIIFPERRDYFGTMPEPSDFDTALFFEDSPKELQENMRKLIKTVPNRFYNAQLLNMSIISAAFIATGNKLDYSETKKALNQIGSGYLAGYVTLPLINTTIHTSFLGLGLLAIIFGVDVHFYYSSRRCNTNLVNDPCLLVDPTGMEKILAWMMVLVLVSAHAACLWAVYVFADARIPSYDDVIDFFGLLRSQDGLLRLKDGGFARVPDIGLRWFLISWPAVIGSAVMVWGFILFSLGLLRLITHWPRGSVAAPPPKRPKSRCSRKWLTRRRR